MRPLGTVLALSVLILLVPPGAAQRPQLPPGGLGGFGRPGMLLMNQSVQEELKMSKEQVDIVSEAIRRIETRYWDDFKKLQALKADEMREKFPELMKSVAEETNKVASEHLRPDQRKRLRQIELQQRGYEAFDEPEVQKALRLTEEQKAKMKVIQDDTRKDVEDIVKAGRGNFLGVMPKVMSTRKEAMDRVQAVLKDEQRQAWKELTGQPFQVKFEPSKPEKLKLTFPPIKKK